MYVSSLMKYFCIPFICPVHVQCILIFQQLTYHPLYVCIVHNEKMYQAIYIVCQSEFTFNTQHHVTFNRDFIATISNWSNENDSFITSLANYIYVIIIIVIRLPTKCFWSDFSAWPLSQVLFCCFSSDRTSWLGETWLGRTDQFLCQTTQSFTCIWFPTPPFR